MEPNEQIEKPNQKNKLWLTIAGIGLVLAKFGKTILFGIKVLLPGLKFAKLGLIFGKFFITGSTMLLSVLIYAQRWGWKFALGFVISIFIHELGHVFAAYKKGIAVSAPMFIPGLGALIFHKTAVRSIWDDAYIAFGGPLFGLFAGILYLVIAICFESNLFKALAYTSFMINLFNLLPIFPLDGGWIVRAVSPRLWLIGIIGMSAMVYYGYIRNPFIFIILILSLPQMWRGIRYGRNDNDKEEPIGTSQRYRMGLSYLGLVAVIAWFMGESLLI